jgi:ABC-2 type transport system ATP-binding protein
MNILIQNLSKTYHGRVHALVGVDLEIETGMFGLLGPNGAGKTTLLRILATLLKPTQGRVVIDGLDIANRQQKWAVKQMLGYLPQELGLYPNLTVYEFLDYIATLKNIYDSSLRSHEITRVMSAAGLSPFAHQLIRTLSGGMKRRVGIAQALLGEPRLLIVDEPTAGLDPEERVRFRTLLGKLAADRIVILSTHIVEDIAASCREMAVLNKGRLCFKGSPAELIQAAEGHTWQVHLAAGVEPNASWQVVSRIQDRDAVQFRVVGSRPVDYADPVQPNLEEAYLVLMQSTE